MSQHNELIKLVLDAGLNLCNSSLLLLFVVFYSVDGFQRNMADGDLTVNVRLDTHDEIQLFATDMNIMIEKIHAVITQVVSGTEHVVSSSEQRGATSEFTLDGVN